MIDDMTMRNLSPNTQETYIRSVAQFSAFHRRSPDQLGIEHLRAFHLHLVSRGLVANSIGVKMAALRFFYGTSLRRPDIGPKLFSNCSLPALIQTSTPTIVTPPRCTTRPMATSMAQPGIPSGR
jgi:site-specific recombinase XerD